MPDNVTSNPNIAWILCEMFIFDNGQFWGRIIHRCQTEAEADDFCRNLPKEPFATERDIPSCFRHCKLIDVYFQCIAIAKKSDVFSQQWVDNVDPRTSLN